MISQKTWATLSARAALAGLQVTSRDATPWGFRVGNGRHPETLYLHLPGDLRLTRIDPQMPRVADWPGDALKWLQDCQAVAEQFEDILEAVLSDALQSGMVDRYSAVCPARRTRDNAP